MDALIRDLTNKLNISQDQAKKGAGTILKLSEEQLGTSFSKISKGLPHTRQLISSAPEWSTRFGDFNMFIGASMPIMGQDHSPCRQKVGTAFQQLDIEASKMDSFIDIVSDHVAKGAGPMASEQIHHLF